VLIHPNGTSKTEYACGNTDPPTRRFGGPTTPTKCRWMSGGKRVLLAVVVGALLSGCGVSDSQLNGTVAGGSVAGVSVPPGQSADYTALADNDTGQTVTLQSATLVPLPKFRVMRLVHVAVEPGRLFVASWVGWPPNVPTVPLNGFRVAPGHRVQILYGEVADSTGNYADLGLRVYTSTNGQQASTRVLSFATTCVDRKHSLVICPTSFVDRVQAVAERLAG